MLRQIHGTFNSQHDDGHGVEKDKMYQLCDSKKYWPMNNMNVCSGRNRKHSTPSKMMAMIWKQTKCKHTD
jgi:hypothetical protein